MRSATRIALKGLGIVALCVCTAPFIGLGIGAAIEQYEYWKVRRAFSKKQKLKFNPFSNITPPDDRDNIDRALALNNDKGLTLIHGKEKIGKSAYVKSRIQKNTKPGVLYIDVKKINDSMKDKADVLPTALADLFGLNNFYKEWLKYSPEIKLNELFFVMSEISKELEEKKGYKPTIVLDNLHDDVIQSLGDNFRPFAAAAIYRGALDGNGAFRFVFVTNGNDLKQYLCPTGIWHGNGIASENSNASKRATSELAIKPALYTNNKLIFTNGWFM